MIQGLRSCVFEIPALPVAETLGYSDQVTQRHAAEAGTTWPDYMA